MKKGFVGNFRFAPTMSFSGLTRESSFLKGFGVWGLILLIFSYAGSAFAQSKDEALRLNQKGREAYQYGRYQEAEKIPI